ncbi:hypothetical protein, partial [Methylocystis sp. SB2]
MQLEAQAQEKLVTTAPPAGADPEALKGDESLIDDIRLLGRLLGDAVREHEGATAFERIETIRRLSVAASRNGDAEA